MYCKHCGTLLNEEAIYCQECGEKQEVNSKSTEVSNNIDFSNLVTGKTTFIASNIGLFLIYFIPWIKFDGINSLYAEMVSSYLDRDLVNISPRMAIKSLNILKDIGNWVGTNLPFKYNLLYLMWLIPLCALISIVLILLNKTNYSILANRISAVITLIFAIYSIILAFSSDYAFKFGLIIVVVIGISSFITSKKLTNNL